MGNLSTIPRSLLLGLAVLYAAATVLYSGSWMYYVRSARRAQLGVEFQRSEITGETRVTAIVRGGPAEQAGLQVGDDIREINHRPLSAMNTFWDAVSRGRPGDIVTIDVRRPGFSSPITLEATLSPAPAPARRSLAQTLAIQFLSSYQVPFVVVGLAVLFLRLDSRDAWLLALLFGGFIAGSPLLNSEPIIHPWVRGFAVAYMVLFRGMSPAVFYYFFATFPASSPIDRRVPWLKSLTLAVAAVVVGPLSLWMLLEGGSHPLNVLVERLRGTVLAVSLNTYFFGVMVLGLVSLTWNSRSSDPEARRKVRVILWGMLCGFGPFLLMMAASIYMREEYTNFPFWVWVPTALALYLVPISFAYAVVKHRVLEIPVLLKRSARYVLVKRGLLVLIFLLAASGTAVFTITFSRFFQVEAKFAMAVGVGFGILLAWAATPVLKGATRRIDRAFFRSAYNAQQILEDLASKSRTATSRGELAGLLEQHLQQALHPTFQVLYLEGKNGSLELERGQAPAGLETLSGDTPFLTDLAERGQPREVAPGDGGGERLPIFAELKPECVVPILGRQPRLSGLLVLGGRLSEEPYSGEDRRLLASAASQAGVALENIGLAEKMAERLEAERRAGEEMEFARQVQARLFPQKIPPLETLEYAGDCIQARQVGGDYYDFLELRPGRVALVLADIAGKGISGALLMANLQANLRSQYAMALENIRQLLASVNRLFYESTGDSSYATLFFADYDDSTRRLRYVNCGHLPPLLLHGCQSSPTAREQRAVEQLGATCTVLGLFDNWECCVAEVQLAPGDTLILYTDGVTEATSAEGEEFGEFRLLATVNTHCDLPAAALLQQIIADVQQFSGGEQGDDITLVVARCSA
jgi:sigma-B regulation protein RsbU (phosphoserine phosphatase)